MKKKLFKRISNVIKRFTRKIAWHFLVLLPVKRNKIVVSQFDGGGYADNPRYIVEDLLSCYPDLMIVWIVSHYYEEMPKQIIQCRKSSLLSIYHLCTAHVWIDNCRKGFIIKKRSQLYIQTWHGGGMMKRVEKDVESSLSKYYLKNAKRDSKKINLFISDSSVQTEHFKTKFWYDGKVFECGAPRYVVFQDKEYIDNAAYSLRRCFNIDVNIGIVLYMPTFRSDYSLDAYKVDYCSVLKCLEEKYKRRFVFLIHLHPNIADKSELMEYSDCIKNANKYEDIQQLIAGSDVMISDYSSSMFDFSLMGKPAFRFAIDLKKYEADRSFVFPFDSYPFPYALSNSELIYQITNYNEEEYLKKLQDYYQKLGLVFSKEAPHQCAEILYGYIKSEYNNPDEYLNSLNNTMIK